MFLSMGLHDLFLAYVVFFILYVQCITECITYQLCVMLFDLDTFKYLLKEGMHVQTPARIAASW